ncbi:MAG TPA: SEC-C metal-binding domain-containing protein [Thermoanaerobaculia bacterium]|nr:SEC-C metal-binding domain-containing protein [Thermoanaerobaculia bacterium]
MKIGRNDPCPCGSGKKYKRCCLALDRDAGAAAADVAGQVRRVAAAAGEWQADVVPMRAAFDDDPAARPAVLLVAADGFIVLSDVLSRPSPEVDDLAATLDEAVRRTGERVGCLPPRLRVRDDDVARALAARFADEGPEVVAGDLEGVDEAAQTYAEQSGVPHAHLRASRPRTWAGWGLPEELVARLFAAAADYHRAAPWKALADSEPLEVTLPGGGRWLAVVLGQGEQQYGLSLYSDPADYRSIYTSRGSADAYHPRGRVLLFDFEAGAEVDRLQRREVMRAGWEVAGADAYPGVIGFNLPAGGLRRAVAEELLTVLRTVPAYVARRTTGAARADEWRHRDSGVTVRPLDFDDLVAGAGALTLLMPGHAIGPNAAPEAAVDAQQRVFDDPDGFIADEVAVVGRFARHLAEAEGLAPSTVDRHANHAGQFVEYLAGCGVPLAALHYRDLLDYLFDWYPRKNGDGVTRRRALPVSLGRFFAYLADEEGLVCPWAWPVLDDREGIEETWTDVPEGPWWEPEVMLWRDEHAEGLEALLMLPDPGLGDADRWGAMMGLDEHRLHHELERRWLLWRDELLLEGVSDRETLLARLVARQREWERAPHPDFGGDSPMMVVWRERREWEKEEARERKARRGKGKGKGKG